MSVTLEYKKLDMVNHDFWNEAKVNYERIDELYSDNVLKDLIFGLKPAEKVDLLNILKIEQSQSQLEEDFLFRTIRMRPDFKNLVYLREFLSRKKRAVEELYERKFADSNTRYDSSDYIKLVHLFYTSPSYIYEVLVVHEWKSKGTGDLFNCTDKYSTELLEGLATKEGYQSKIINVLYDFSGQSNEYKMVAHSELSNKHYIYLMYKLTKDTKRPGFDMAKRVKDVDQLMFSINVADGIVEIKTPTKTDFYGLQKYFKENVGELAEIKHKVFTEYSEVTLTKVFREGEAASGEEPEDFEINKIIFTNSLLSKSPEITIQLPKSDIWLSVMDAFRRRVVDLNSLKDIKQIFFTSERSSRSVRSLQVGEGNVLFKLDDSNLDEEKKNSIMKKFQQKFGFPINQPIENKFKAGESEKVDRLLRLSFDEISEESDLYKNLIQKEFIQKVEIVKCKCTHCNAVFDLSEVIVRNTCPTCSGNEMFEEKQIEQKIDHDKLESFVFILLKNFVKQSDECEELPISTITYRGKKFRVYRFLHQRKPYQCILSGSILPKKMLEMLERQLVPTVLIYYGVDRETTNVFSLDTIFHTTFGAIFTSQDMPEFIRLMTTAIESLEERTHHLINTAATKASAKIKDVGDRTDDLTDYDADMFEDDVFALIKHLVPNSEKWGKEMKGKAVPEGIFALQYMKREGMNAVQQKVVFSYDCKLTKEKQGYDLRSDEKRKGLDYVQRLNNLSEISAYCTNNQVTAHVFVSNKFREGQIKTMADYFHQEIGREYIGRPIFITAKVLVYLHSQFMKHRDDIIKVNDIFMEKLHKLLTTEDFIVTTELVDELIDDVSYAAKQYTELDTNRVTKKLKK
ncbi:hypothetical protein [Paenibacillus sp. J2TS4]|uniref:hypothetical protein n=1 Tax=Paenibacillus sp. J2TS4 TaxID=2807194 RepID=UPI001B023D88|nr:hypothetical protein [Paenibacillus sp. J2TS4]GIP34245.1 hypothetical protein J2TS4_34550 [Paenibacillus sp. J2TS4]